MQTKLVNYVCGAELIDLDDEGNVIDKFRLEPREIMGREGLVAWAAEIESVIAERTKQLNEQPQPNRAARRSKKKN